MLVEDSYELYEKLHALALLQHAPPFWWPGYGSFEVVPGVILTQNSLWKRVECSLDNLRYNRLLSLEAIHRCDMSLLQAVIRPSGMPTNKAKYLKALVANIIDEFENFEYFSEQVSRVWLLEQKGIGPESADAILCYACQRSEMVVDRYTQRLVAALGYEFESYDALKQWCENLHVNFDTAQLPRVYAEFHGMIVAYMKANASGKNVNIIFK